MSEAVLEEPEVVEEVIEQVEDEAITEPIISEEEDFEVTLGEESLTSESGEKEEAPEWVKEVRNTNRELKKQNKQLLKEQAERLAAEENKPTALREKPTLESVDYDEDKLSEELGLWIGEKAEVEK